MFKSKSGGRAKINQAIAEAKKKQKKKPAKKKAPARKKTAAKKEPLKQNQEGESSAPSSESPEY